MLFSKHSQSIYILVNVYHCIIFKLLLSQYESKLCVFCINLLATVKITFNAANTWFLTSAFMQGTNKE